MKLFLAFLALGAVAAPPKDGPYLTWLADTFIQNGVKSDLLGYQPATLYMGFEKAYELKRDEKYLRWLRGQIDGKVVQQDGTIKGWKDGVYSLDEYRMANIYLYLYGQTGEEKYKSAADIVRNHINSHPRTPSGGFWHRKPQFANQMWLDGIFMADSFYARWTGLFDKDNATAWDDILLQYTLLNNHTLDLESGLMVHGWAEITDKAPWADPATGRAPHVWGRAVGWYFMSLIETLQVFPKFHPGYVKLMHIYTGLASALKKAQDPKSHGWWQVMDAPYPGKKGNYIESSASAMFTFGLLKGVKLGYLKESEFLQTAKNAYRGLVHEFVRPGKNGTLSFTGTVAECGLASSNYYTSVRTTSNDYKGSGPFMIASYEWETWAKEAR
ncbi:hypothetical protein QQS21_000846 [Conoideocrella luteorostrata]|uniref:Uncharacterized protein n=1 Tax=Conoideocrella luteorostrata TaxID=1105319 RepID=A0AAJ0D1B0_9HYPO|nr:hypothetical protein QQS21_000846 [Conoideocrella luteorostrata]